VEEKGGRIKEAEDGDNPEEEEEEVKEGKKEEEEENIGGKDGVGQKLSATKGRFSGGIFENVFFRRFTPWGVV